MDWIPKTPLQWDWETLALFSEKDCEITKPPNLKVKGGADFSNGSSCSAGGRTFSRPELGNVLSRSSMSLPIDCSTLSGKRATVLNFDSGEEISENINKNNILSKMEGSSSVTVSADGPKELVIGLKLGKRTYFEDSSAGSNTKNTASVSSTPVSASSVKKQKEPQQKLQINCQVEGCKTDLSAAKEYHRKHRVCGTHSKSPKVVVAGLERRFCQQCSRFHDLSEFDQKKRSCRRRLSDHNARRRKPPPETVTFNSSLLSAPYYDDRHQMNLVFGRSPICHMNAATNASWNNISGGFELRQYKGSKGEHFLLEAFPTNAPTVLRDFDGRLPYKGTTAEVLNQVEPPVGVSSLVGVQDAGRALSLLSSDSFGSFYFGPVSAVQYADTNISSFTYPAIHTVDTASGFWQDQQYPAKDMSFNLHNNSVQFPGFQPHKTAHETFLFDSNQIH